MPVLRDPSALEDDDAVGEHRGVDGVVRDDEPRTGCVGEVAPELAADLQARAGVERGERLVEQQETRFADERTRERDPLGLATGQLRRACRPCDRRGRRGRATRRHVRARRAWARRGCAAETRRSRAR